MAAPALFDCPKVFPYFFPLQIAQPHTAMHTAEAKTVAAQRFLGQAHTRFYRPLIIQIPPSAPHPYNPNLFPIGDGFGLLVFSDRFESTHFRNGVQRKPASKPRGSEREASPINAKGPAQPFPRYVRPPFLSLFCFWARHSRRASSQSISLTVFLSLRYVNSPSSFTMEGAAAEPRTGRPQNRHSRHRLRGI